MTDLSDEELCRVEAAARDDDGHWLTTEGPDVVLALVAALREARASYQFMVSRDAYNVALETIADVRRERDEERRLADVRGELLTACESERDALRAEVAALRAAMPSDEEMSGLRGVLRRRSNGEIDVESWFRRIEKFESARGAR